MSSDEESDRSRSRSGSDSEERANRSGSDSEGSERSRSSRSNSDKSDRSRSRSESRSDASEGVEKSEEEVGKSEVEEEHKDEANPEERPQFVLTHEVKIDVMGHPTTTSDEKDKFESTDRSSFTFDKSITKYRSTKPLKIILDVNSELDSLLSDLSKNIKSFNKAKDNDILEDFISDTPKSQSLRRPVINNFSFTKKFEEPLSENDYLIARDNLIRERPIGVADNIYGAKYTRNTGTVELPDINTKLHPPSYYYQQRKKNENREYTTEDRENREFFVTDSHNVLPDANKYHAYRSKITIDPNVYKPRSINQAIDILLNKN
jgi:hypothetical protein